MAGGGEPAKAMYGAMEQQVGMQPYYTLWSVLGWVSVRVNPKLAG